MNTFMTIYCDCGKVGCKTKLNVHDGKIWFTDHEGNTTSMYVNENSIKLLVMLFQSMLQELEEKI